MPIKMCIMHKFLGIVIKDVHHEESDQPKAVKRKLLQKTLK